MTDQRNQRQFRNEQAVSLLELAKKAGVAWAVGLMIVMLIVGVCYAIDVLLLVFAGVMFAIFLRGLGDFVSKHTRLEEKWSLGATVLCLVAVLTVGAWSLAPSIAKQTDQLRQSMPKSVERIEERMKQYEWGRWVLEKAHESNDQFPRRRDVFSSIAGAVSGTLEAVGAAVVILFTGLYLAVQPRLYTEGIIKLIAIGKRDRAREIVSQIGAALKWWLLGKLVSMLFVGIVTWLGLFLLGIDIALTLAVLAALLTFIPNFGPIIAAVPAVLLGSLDTTMTAVWVVVLYVAIQTVESYVLTPLIQQQTVSLPPALTITTQLIMATLVGGIGLALATPITVVTLVLIRSLYVEDILGDTSQGIGNGT